MQNNPKYTQLLQRMTRRILDGQYPPGTQIPSEHELMAEFQVGRNTARRVLEELQEMGMVRRSQGKRGIVTENRIVDRFGQTRRVTELLKENRQFSYSRVLFAGTQPIPARMADRFVLPADGEVVRLWRLRLADKTPLVLNDTYFDRDTFSFLLNNDLENQSLDAFISRTTGLNKGREERDLELTILSEQEAQHLACQPGDPAFLQTQWVWDQYGRPLYFNRSIYHPYLIKFTYTIDH